jgi:penicillin-binding protein 1C
MRRPSAWHVGLLLGGLVLSLAVLLDRLLPPRLDRLADVSTVVRDTQGNVLRAFLAADGHWRLPAKAAEISPRLVELLIRIEDKRFRSHPGVDPLALARALAQWAQHGRPVSGASTLTMQTARLLEPRPRTLAAKLIEMLRALQLERRYTKDKILDIYLTLAPYGGNLAGARAASLAYFDKEPRELSDAEAALLVALPQSPSRLRPDRHLDRAIWARDKVLLRAGLPAALLAEARAEAVPGLRQRLPLAAPHLAERLRRQARQLPVIDSTIDGALQQAIEAIARRLQGELGRQTAVALLVVENGARAVRAYVAGASYFDEPRRGQVDLVRAQRSPGSTLKPFVYALAFDDGVLHPDTVVPDVPTRFGDYAPVNFDRRFMGEVTAREALIHSLNVPAVAVLERIGASRFTTALDEVGVRLKLPPQRGAGEPPGLPIVLGGAGLSLEQLVTLYVGLANDGTVVPLRLTAAAPPPQEEPRLVGPSAARQVAAILAQVPPPDGIAAGGSGRRPIAYKTGTSYGFRDAWAIGFTPRYTVGVWIGRADGTPSPDHWGRQTAAPLLFRVFDLLPAEPRAEPIELRSPDLPPNLRRLALRAEAQVPLSARRTPDRPLKILFPAEDSAVGPHDGRIPLRVAGGRLPLSWLIDDRPLAAPTSRRELFWAPDDDGYTKLTVIDATGSSATVVFRVGPADDKD